MYIELYIWLTPAQLIFLKTVVHSHIFHTVVHPATPVEPHDDVAPQPDYDPFRVSEQKRECQTSMRECTCSGGLGYIGC